MYNKTFQQIEIDYTFAVGLIFTVRHHVLRNSLKMLDNVVKIMARN